MDQITNWMLQSRETRLALKVEAIKMLLSIAQEEHNEADVIFYTRRLNDVQMCLDNPDIEIQEAEGADLPFLTTLSDNLEEDDLQDIFGAGTLVCSDDYIEYVKNKAEAHADFRATMQQSAEENAVNMGYSEMHY